MADMHSTRSDSFAPKDDPFSSPGTSRRRAKIVCTIGPVSNSEEMIRDLMLLGMDVARLNFSHGTHEQHAVVIERLRKVASELNRSICILQDLQGPKIRTGRLASSAPVALKKGQTVTITPKDVPGTTEIISTTYQNLADDVKPGERILLSDGRIELVVQEVREGEVVCEVLNGGLLGENQGINLPGTNVSIPSLTAKDLRDLEFGLKQGVDLVAISFVRTVNDVVRAKNAIAAYRSDVGLIAKLEKPQAIENLDGILEAAVGVMVARGDLGVEVAPEKVPLIQKYVIRRALDFRRPVITATQMLESMTDSPRPTRAEASDVANAVFDGTDAVMLSGETASGKYPREAVEMMARIVAETEAHSLNPLTPGHREAGPLSVAETICESMAHAAKDLKMGAIAVFTETATTARMLSKYRPAADIYAFSSSETVRNRMNALWGTTPLMCPPKLSVERMAQFAEEELLRLNVLSPGDIFGLVAGTQNTTGATNFMRLIQVRDDAEQSNQAAGNSTAATVIS
jgi:pyruvate kinase